MTRNQYHQRITAKHTSNENRIRSKMEDTMTRRRAAMLVLTTVLTLGWRLQSFAHEGHDHKIMGTVTMAALDHVMVKDRDGKDVTIKVTKDTKVRSKPVITIDQIKPGTRVVVTATQAKDQSFTAKAIEVGGPAAGK